ncbi:MAG: carbon-nitrogen hydrolase family protein [Parvularculaceae bacterium]
MTGARGRPIRIAAAQMRSGVDWMRNLDACADLVRAAAADGADLIATPEMTTLLDRDRRRLLENLPENAAAREREFFGGLAADLDVWILIGSSPEPLDDGRLANRGRLYRPNGGVAATYDKIHMFDVALPTGETWTESRAYAPGAGASLVHTPLGRLGLTICYDVRFPHLYRALAQAGADVIFVPAAFTRPTGEAHWETLLRARAIECGAFVVAPAQGGTHDDGRDTWGRAMIVGPWGDVRAASSDDAPGIVAADADLADVDAAREAIPSLGHDRAFELEVFECD